MNGIANLFPRVVAVTMSFVVVLSAQGQTRDTSPEPAGEVQGPVNQMCPVSPDEEIDPRFVVEYQGKKVGLCCRKCRRKFQENPEAFIANLPQIKTVALEQDAAPQEDHASGAEHDHPQNTPADDTSKPAGHQEPDTSSHEHTDASEISPDTAADASTEHDHNKDHDSDSPRIFSWLGKFHPPTTHIPIGMLIGAALAESLFILTRRELFQHAAAFCVSIAAAGALAAVTLGWFNGGFTLTDDDWVQTLHRWLGTATATMALITLMLLIRSSKKDSPPMHRRWFRVALFSTATLIGITGFFGGALVYGLNHYAW